MVIKIIDFIKHRKFYYALSLLLVLLSVFSLFFWGVNPGIEFSGGSVFEGYYEEERPSVSEIEESLVQAGVKDVRVQHMEEDRFIVRTSSADEETYEKISSAMEGAKEEYFEAIGPAVGEELRSRSVTVILIASLLVIIYVAISFRGEQLVNSGRYGAVAVGVAILHDVLILVGLFSVLGHFYGVQMTIPIVVAILTTLGYSINDTVVVFDRVRENLERGTEKGFYKIVNRSLTETLGRSLATSITTILVLLDVLLMGASTLFYFMLALIVGIAIGTYSSVFLAGPLLYSLTKSK